jgi:lon-related putative ATP-dependent protease
MRELIEDLKAALPAVFESEDYRARRSAIDDEFERRQGEGLSELKRKANKQNIVIIRTPLGIGLAPSREGKIVPPEEFSSWPEDERRAVQETIQSLEQEFEQLMRKAPSLEKERRAQIKKLDGETARAVIDQAISEVKNQFSEFEKVLAYLAGVRDDLINNVPLFLARGEDEEISVSELVVTGALDRYAVNILVSQQGAAQAPVVEELHPTLGNLVGRVEYTSRHGLLVTNFRFIKAGALHRANGGYLLLDARSLLTEPFSWAALKRALHRRDVRPEDPAHLIGLTTAVSLDPDAIPVDVKVVLFGDRLLYYLLSILDPELHEHFKVLADFADDYERSPEGEAGFARYVATIAKAEGLKPLDRNGVARVIEHAARLAEHSRKLTLLLDDIRELLIEADARSNRSGREATSRADVQEAIDQKVRRAARLRDRAQEQILQDVTVIATEGERVGEVNGLSVLEVGGFSFGRPTRITCQVRPGTGRVVDIEREVALGGPLHSKGVLILSGLLAGRYALDTPMSLHASLVFEQSYSPVEGDSASSAELFALLSALADLPLRQDIAVTGSVDQHGRIQAVGGVNEKIEGFFDICRARGLTGTQGVAIPQANAQHLMLRQDVVEACAADRFAVYAIDTADQGMALLTGSLAGERGGDGRYPETSVNQRIEERLRAFAEVRRSFAGRQLQEESEKD